MITHRFLNVFNLRKILAASLLIAVLALGNACAAELLAPTQESVRREAVVRSVIDGDTFDTTTGERVRLIGVDTPEYQPHRHKIQFYGSEARDYSMGLLSGQKVLLESDVEPKDKYGRTLAYVYLADGRFVNLLLAQNGFAKAKLYKPNGRYYSLLKDAEREAKRKKLGLWAKKS